MGQQWLFNWSQAQRGYPRQRRIVTEVSDENLNTKNGK